MGRYTAYMQVPHEIYEDKEFLKAFNPEQRLRDAVVRAGVHPVGPMTFMYQKIHPYTVDPYIFCTRWEKIKIFLRITERPEPYEVRDWGIRGVVEVLEDDPNAP